MQTPITIVNPVMGVWPKELSLVLSGEWGKWIPMLVP